MHRDVVGFLIGRHSFAIDSAEASTQVYDRLAEAIALPRGGGPEASVLAGADRVSNFELEYADGDLRHRNRRLRNVGPICRLTLHELEGRVFVQGRVTMPPGPGFVLAGTVGATLALVQILRGDASIWPFFAAWVAFAAVGLMLGRTAATGARRIEGTLREVLTRPIPNAARSDAEFGAVH